MNVDCSVKSRRTTCSNTVFFNDISTFELQDEIKNNDIDIKLYFHFAIIMKADKIRNRPSLKPGSIRKNSIWALKSIHMYSEFETSFEIVTFLLSADFLVHLYPPRSTGQQEPRVSTLRPAHRSPVILFLSFYVYK